MASKAKAPRTVVRTVLKQGKRLNSLIRFVVLAALTGRMMASASKFPANALAIERWKFNAKSAAASLNEIAPMMSAIIWIGCRNGFRSASLLDGTV